MATMTSIMCGPGSDALSNGYSADSVPAQQQQQLNCVASAATANGDTAHPNVFVRGLPLAWGESELASVFAAYGELSSIRLVRHSMTKHSLGYGFVRFSHVQDAQAAISSLDGTTVLGHKLQVKFADADAGPPAAASPSGLTPSDSCYAKHLPASWGAREVQQLFEAHGAVLDVKLFPCLDQFRGASALVRMASVEAAERAINALNNTTPANGVQSLIVRFAESAAEKAARLQRRERQQQQQQQQQASRAAAAGLPRSALSSGNLGPLNSQHSLLATSPALLSPEQQLQQSVLQALSALSLGAADSTLSLPQLVGMGSGGLAAPPTPQLVRPPPAAAVPLAPPIQVNYQPPVLSTVALRGLPQNADRLWVYEHFARFGPIASMRLVFDETTGLCTGSGIINYADHGAGDRARQVLSGMRAGDKVLQVLVQQAGQGSAGPGVLTPQASGQGPSLAQRQASQAAVAAMAAAGLQGMPSSTMPMGYGGDGTPASPLALAFPTSTADWGQSPFNMSGM